MGMAAGSPSFSECCRCGLRWSALMRGCLALRFSLCTALLSAAYLDAPTVAVGWCGCGLCCACQLPACRLAPVCLCCLVPRLPSFWLSLLHPARTTVYRNVLFSQPPLPALHFAALHFCGSCVPACLAAFTSYCAGAGFVVTFRVLLCLAGLFPLLCCLALCRSAFCDGCLSA